MSKKYRESFENYQLGKNKPMSIELDRANLAKYRDLADNPLYYENALKYLGGELYRASLGYDLIWDLKAERDLMLCLDYVLTDYRERNLYYLEEIKLTRDTTVHGIRWPRGVAPKTHRFDLQYPHELKNGECLTARINLLDKPMHVDLERADGEVFSVQYMRYQNLLNNGKFKRKKTYELTKTSNPSREAKSPSTRKAKGLRLVKSFSSENPTQPLPFKLYNLR